VIANQGGGFTVESVTAGISNQLVVDKVVLATPSLPRLSIFPFAAPVKPRPFVHCHDTIVQASGVNPVYFGLQPGDRLPDTTFSPPRFGKFNAVHQETMLGAYYTGPP